MSVPVAASKAANASLLDGYTQLVFVSCSAGVRWSWTAEREPVPDAAADARPIGGDDKDDTTTTTTATTTPLNADPCGPQCRVPSTGPGLPSRLHCRLHRREPDTLQSRYLQRIRSRGTGVLPTASDMNVVARNAAREPLSGRPRRCPG